MYSEETYWIWLSSVPGIGPNRFYKLIEMFGNAYNVWQAVSSDKSQAIGVLDAKSWNSLRQSCNEQYIQLLLDKLYKNDVNAVLLSSPSYPSNLKNIYNPPPVLYMKGNVDDNTDRLALAVVGTRRCSAYGRAVVDKLCPPLVEAGITIISGMARGVDGLAHRAAIQSNGRTIAVLGSGVDRIYPPEHRQLYYDIILHGAVVSEFPPGMEPIRNNFPQRNRVISGLSMATLVIEAGDKSGALITADFALEQGRDVMAVPGNITSANSIGTNRLIKQGAKPVTNADDILEEFGINIVNSMIAGKKMDNYQLTIDEQKVLAFFEDGQSIDAEKLCELSKMGIAQVNALLTSLEIKGIIKQLAGTLFVKTL